MLGPMADDRARGEGEGEAPPAGDGDPAVPSVEPRILAAWHEWLGALAVNPEAAIAAAHVYGELDPDAREAWLAALVEDTPKLDVPLVAIYAPLLAVETDPERRERIEMLLAAESMTERLPAVRALWGVAPDASHVAALIAPLYLRFVRVLWCRYDPREGFVWARHDAMLRDADAPQDGSVVDGVCLEATPLKPAIEELAHAVLAQGRRGVELPAPLHLFADLFDAHVDDLAI
jgi:hypothetical protein